MTIVTPGYREAAERRSLEEMRSVDDLGLFHEHVDKLLSESDLDSMASEAQFDLRDVHGQTVLSWAMCVGNLCLVQWLVNEAGADVMATDEHGRNVLMKTVDLNIVQWLVENGGLDVSSDQRRTNATLSELPAKGACRGTQRNVPSSRDTEKKNVS